MTFVADLITWITDLNTRMPVLSIVLGAGSVTAILTTVCFASSDLLWRSNEYIV